MNTPDNSSFDYRSTIQSWATRNGFAHWAVAMMWLIAAFVLFQLSAGAVYTALLFLAGEVQSVSDLEAAMMSRLDLLFIGNSVGQVVFLGAATFLVVKLNTAGETAREFLRISWDDQTVKYLVLAALFVVVVQPIVLFLGFLNSFLPVPDSMSLMQESQYEMIKNFLTSDGVMWFGLFHIALIPAFAEEFLFRGYILRAFEKSWGIIVAIIVSSLIFGMFHLQITNLLPLAALGAMLAVLTVYSGSIWPAVLAHFINNGAAVVTATYYPEIAFGDLSASTMPPIWALALSIICTAVLVRYMVSSSKNSILS